MNKEVRATLKLEDGTELQGQSFGFEGSVSGEVVFNTAMTGYPESLTDPSYQGQILVSTYPLIGNYGVPAQKFENGLQKYFESSTVQITGLIISDYSFDFSHWNAEKSLADWLKENEIPGVFGIDTRALTKVLREKGSMLGKIIIGDDIDQYDPNLDNLVAKVSTATIEKYGNGEHKIALIDCGVKNNIIRCFIERNATVYRIPWNYDFKQMDYDALFISNGPGDPKMCTETIQNLRTAFTDDKPIFGICLGTQLMALASGAETYKLKYGHRSHNQPVLMSGTNRCYITSQNHGFTIDGETLSDDWEISFINVNDNTCEGIRHKTKPFFSSQFHPEASSGPVDTEFLFDDFIELIEQYKSNL
jgi:carbamoyl-phosphate synthase small subunit